MPALVAGCYTYTPIQPSALSPGVGVRARVSAATAERIAPLLGTTDARVVTGTLIENASGTLIVEVPTIVQAGVGTSTQSLYQRISIAPGDVLELESRTLDRTRTAVVVGIAAAIGGSAAIAALHGSPGNDKPPGGTSTDSRIVVWRWHY